MLLARSLRTESERSKGSFADSHERAAGDENSSLPFLGMTRIHRVRRTYDHRLRDAIAATGNADLFRNVAIPASTRRTWARGEVRPVVAAVHVELEVYELLEQVDKLRQRAKVQAVMIGLLVRLLRLRGGKLDADRVPDGQTKSAVLRAIASASGLRARGNPFGADASTFIENISCGTPRRLQALTKSRFRYPKETSFSTIGLACSVNSRCSSARAQGSR